MQICSLKSCFGYAIPEISCNDQSSDEATYRGNHQVTACDQDVLQSYNQGGGPIPDLQELLGMGGASLWIGGVVL